MHCFREKKWRGRREEESAGATSCVGRGQRDQQGLTLKKASDRRERVRGQRGHRGDYLCGLPLEQTQIFSPCGGIRRTIEANSL